MGSTRFDMTRLPWVAAMIMSGVSAAIPLGLGWLLVWNVASELGNGAAFFARGWMVALTFSWSAWLLACAWVLSCRSPQFHRVAAMLLLFALPSASGFALSCVVAPPVFFGVEGPWGGIIWGIVLGLFFAIPLTTTIFLLLLWPRPKGGR